MRAFVSAALLLWSACAWAQHFTVAADGSGDFRTVQQAIDAAPDYCKQSETLILIKAGTYREKITIPASKQRLHLKGEGAEKTIITWDDYALRKGSTGYEMGTSATSTVFLYGSDFLAEDISVENSAGAGKAIGQACAITVDADRVAFLRCRFVANQDTIYTFGKDQHQYWQDCWIEGTTDFIFGASTCWSENCTILSKIDSYVTAASTPQGREFGYVFHRCSLIAADGVSKCYLGRPWRKYAKTVFLECSMGSHIRPEGWHNWGKPYAESTTLYAEWRSSGEGARGPRASWAHELSDAQAALYSPARVLEAGAEEDKNGNMIPTEWFFKVF